MVMSLTYYILATLRKTLRMETSRNLQEAFLKFNKERILKQQINYSMAQKAPPVTYDRSPLTAKCHVCRLIAAAVKELFTLSLPGCIYMLYLIYLGTGVTSQLWEPP